MQERHATNTLRSCSQVRAVYRGLHSQDIEMTGVGLEPRSNLGPSLSPSRAFSQERFTGPLPKESEAPLLLTGFLVGDTYSWLVGTCDLLHLLRIPKRSYFPQRLILSGLLDIAMRQFYCYFGSGAGDLSRMS